MKKLFSYFGCVLTAIMLSTSCISPFNPRIVIENDYIRYEIARNGNNLSFTDKVSGINYLYTDSVSYCAYIMQNGIEHHPASVSYKNDLLSIDFGDAGVIAEILINKSKDRITLEVAEVKGLAESLTFLNIPLTLKGMPDEPFAACALAMNLITNVRQLPAMQNHLWAGCYDRFGAKGAKITLLGVPQKEILPLIRDVMEKAEDIPHSKAGGAWAELNKEGYGSYLMNFGTLTESTVDEWIEMCSLLGFNQIDSHGGGSFFRFGDFELNPEKWPNGWADFKRINNRLLDAGISSIFHTYAFFIDKKSKYVSPVPHPDLAYFNSFTLAEPTGLDNSEITVNESTAGISTITGFFVRNSLTLRIGDELISFSGVTDTPPYKFTGCKRGVNGTQAFAHAADEKVFHLKEMFGLYVPGHDTELFKEIARRTAEIVNECNFKGIYFDAIDGSGILDGDENFWYHSTKFVLEVAKHLTPPVGMEMSAMIHHWWHYRSRWQAWDRPVRGYKRFIDIHAEEIRNNGLLLPLHLGWWGNQTWDPPQVEPTFTDDIEYLCCKMIGHNAGLSMLGGVDKQTLDEKPLLRRLAAIIKQYEILRHKGYFGDSIRNLLRQPGKEFTLFQDNNADWRFKPIAYNRHKVEGIDHPSANWTVNNDFDPQPVMLRIETLMAVTSYDDDNSIVLEDFSEVGSFTDKMSAEGVTGSIVNSNDELIYGKPTGKFSALNKGISPREGSWIKKEKKFDPWLNISKNKALGVWIKGDGNGELLNFRLESPLHISYGARGDHFVKIDFTGWKYFELVEIESSEFSNYQWPESGLYDTYRNTIDFRNIDRLQLWYNNLPEGKEVECMIGPVKALPIVSVTIKNPSVKIGGKEIVFPVSMESGMYLEFKSATDCKLYSPEGKLLKEVKLQGSIPSLIKGANDVTFSCNGPEGMNARVQVTVICEGMPLENK